MKTVLKTRVSLINYFAGILVFSTSINFNIYAQSVGIHNDNPTGLLEIGESCTTNAAVVDQENTIGSIVSNETGVFQSFTSDVTGCLKQIDVYVDQVSIADITYNLQLYKGDLGSLIPLGISSTTYNFDSPKISFNDLGEVDVVQGEQYTYHLTASDNFGPRQTKALYGGDNYVGGSSSVGPSADFRFSTFVSERSSVQALKIDDNGNIGLGVDAPTSKLDIDGNIRMREGAGNGYLMTSDANGNMTWENPSIISGLDDWENNSYGISYNSGKVGIGITPGGFSPDFEVHGSTQFNVDNKSFMINTSSNTLLYIDGITKKVGIGNPSSNATLNVQGDAIFNDNGGNNDFRIESNNNDHMFFLDADYNRIGIGIPSTSPPLTTLDVEESFRVADGNSSSFTVYPHSVNISPPLSVFQGAIFNEIGADNDFRIESDLNPNMFTLDASTDRIGIGTNLPTATFDVNGSASFNSFGSDKDFRISSVSNSNIFYVDASTNSIGIGTLLPNATLDVRGSAVFNEAGGNNDFRVESDLLPNMFKLDASSNKIGINEPTPDAMLHIKQYGASEKALLLENNDNTNNWGFEIGTSFLYLDYNGVDIGYWSSVTGDYISTSDRNAKKDISYLNEPILDKIDHLKPAFYRLNHADSNAARNLGFIAQEVEEYFPEIVRKRDDGGGLGLHYSDFGVLAIKAIQEQQEIIAAQDEKILKLENALESLMERVEQLEQK